MATVAPPTVASTTRTITATQAACLLAAPLVALVARLLMPPWYQDQNSKPDNVRYLAELADSPVRGDVGADLTLLSAVLFAGAAVVLAGIVRRRMPRLGLAGAALMGVGAAGLTAVSALALTGGQLAQAGDRGRMVALMDQLMTASPFQIYFVALVGGAIGAVLLAIGLYRSQVVPRAAAVLAGLGIAAVMATATGPAVVFVTGAAVIAVAGLGWVALAARRFTSG